MYPVYSEFYLKMKFLGILVKILDNSLLEEKNVFDVLSKLGICRN